MFEQDIELARLLIEKLTELDERGAEADEKLRAAREELEQARTVRDERSTYLEILSRAAKVLERSDLEVESPETAGIEARIAELEEETTAIDVEAQKYRDLLTELRQTAPHLVAAAEGEPTAEVTPASTADESATEATPAESEESTANTLESAEMAEAEDAPAAIENEPEQESAAGSTAVEQVLSRFNLGGLKTREAITLGRGAAYIVDGSSVVERVPHYDFYMRKIEETEARDELIRDIDHLGRELSGSFHLVFNSWHQPSVTFGNDLSVVYATGEGEGTDQAGERRLRELVSELAPTHRNVCVVTGNTSLADSVRGQGIHIIPLGEFFST